MHSIFGGEFDGDASKANQAVRQDLDPISSQRILPHIFLSVADSLSSPGIISTEVEIEFNPIRSTQIHQREVDLS